MPKSSGQQLAHSKGPFGLEEDLRTTGQRSQDNRGGIIGPAFSLGIVSLPGYFSCGASPAKASEIQRNPKQCRPELLPGYLNDFRISIGSFSNMVEQECCYLDFVGFRWISLDFKKGTPNEPKPMYIAWEQAS